MQTKWSSRFLAVFNLFVLFITIPVVAAPYDLIDLGSLGGVTNYSYGINEFNQVTGYSDGMIIPDDQIDSENPPEACQQPNGPFTFQEFCSHAYLYSDGVISDLGDLGLNRSFGFAINDNSTIVGISTVEIDDGDDETLNESHESAFISFAGGQVQALPYPDESVDLPETINPQQRALDISNDRKIVGYTLIPLSDDAEEDTVQNRPYLYDYDTNSFTLIPLFSDEIARAGSARAINSSSVVVGWAQTDDEGNPIHALRWDPATPEISTDLGTLGGYTSKAYNINDNNFIVGVSDTSTEFGDNENLGFVYDPEAETAMIAIPEFSDAESFRTSTAYAINNNNLIVGTAQISSGNSPRRTAFLYDYDNETLINLNDMVDCSLNWDLQIARDINDTGAIIGLGTIDDQVRAFLLIPTEDTEATNCTELREIEEQERELEYKGETGSGSTGLFSLLLLTLIGCRHLRKS